MSGQLVICPKPVFDYDMPEIGTDYLADVALTKPSDINPVLKQWKALQTLELRHFNIKAMKKLDFKPCKNLTKVYINGIFPTGTYVLSYLHTYLVVGKVYKYKTVTAYH